MPRIAPIVASLIAYVDIRRRDEMFAAYSHHPDESRFSRVHPRIRMQQYAIDPAENAGIDTDPEPQGENRQKRKFRIRKK